MNLQLSFLIAAHNEEAIISTALDNLLHLPYTNFEVLIGLDGCTDRTEQIVKEFRQKSNKFKYYILRSRNGKPEVIDLLMKHARGDVVIIHDADWIFKIGDAQSMRKFVSIFEDNTIGGIAESLPVEWDKERLKDGNIVFRMVAYSAYYWMKYQKERFSCVQENKNYIQNPKMFLTNIFRRTLYKKNTTLGDDFERTFNIMENGYKIILVNDASMPRMISVYDTISLKDLFKQKIRTAVARKQINGMYRIGLFDYYIPCNYFILKESFKKKISIGFLMVGWIFITSLGQFASIFFKKNTKEGWTLRARR